MSMGIRLRPLDILFYSFIHFRHFNLGFDTWIVVLGLTVYLGYGLLIVEDVFFFPLHELIMIEMTIGTTIDNSLRNVAP